MSNVTVEKVVEKLYALRERRAQLKKESDELKMQEEKLENWLLWSLHKNGLSKMGVEIPAGKVTVFSKEKTSVSIADWDEALAYVKKHEAWDLLYHQLSSRGVQEIFERGEHVPGVNLHREEVVGVQKR